MIRSADPKHPHALLQGMINVLILEDNPDIMEAQKENLDHPFYAISTATTQTAAKNLFDRKHHQVCLMDMGITDCENDQLHLLRYGAAKTSFLVVTGSSSPKLGALCREAGAKDILEKNTIEGAQLRDSVNRWGMMNMICPEYDPVHNTPINRAVAVLLEKQPVSVDTWAQDLNIDASVLRKLWNARGLQSKHVLAFYHLCTTAFELELNPPDGPSSPLAQRWTEHADYHLAHRSAFLSLMSREP